MVAAIKLLVIEQLFKPSLLWAGHIVMSMKQLFIQVEYTANFVIKD
jgi:hypothetical protein